MAAVLLEATWQSKGKEESFPMHYRKLLIVGSVALLISWGSTWAQQQSPNTPSQNPNATSQSPTPQSPATPANPTTTDNPSVSSSSADATEKMTNGKEKHWTGSLVDIKCMAKTLGSESQAPSSTGASAAPTPHFAPQSPDQFQQSSQGGGTGANPAGSAGSPNQPSTAPTYPGQDSGQNPDMSQGQSQRAAAAAQRMDAAAKQCTATPSTQSFGLALSDGKVMQLDQEGNAKASDALKSINVPPGKKIKAKVTGLAQDNNTVQVASVELKGKKVNPSPSLGTQAGEVK
jgi:hypothetical protein